MADVDEARKSTVIRWATGEEGQGLVEYAFILLLVVSVVVGTVRGFGGGVLVLYQLANAIYSGG